MSSATGNFVDGLQEAIRQNPVSAALVGVGLLWMFTGGNRLTAAAAVLGPAAKSVASGALSGVQHSVDAVGSAGGSVRAMGARASDSVQETLSDAASIVGNAASRAYESAKDGMSSTLQSTSGNVPPGELLQAWDGALLQNLKRTLERQPLLLGAMGLAIGAGMAAAFPTTQKEQDFAGEAAEGVIAQAKDIASSTAEKLSAAASRTLDAVKQEAATQGLTIQAAKDGAAAIGDKVKSVANAAGAKPRSNS